MEELVASAIRDAHRERCIAAVFPELTIDDDMRQRIAELLGSKPWLGEDSASDEVQRTPALVVAGSWHRERDGHHYNITSVLDGDGNPIADYAKRLPFTDERDRIERIESGEELLVLIFDNCAIGFGICLDFCDRRYEQVYDQLDIDFVLIPSCGNDRTMEGHIRNAELLWMKRASRTMVVQQAYPARKDDAPGYVLPPKGKIATDPAQLVEAKPWSVVTTLEGGR
jgi:predicted amidohydrolase